MSWAVDDKELTTTCLTNGSWSRDPAMMPSCEEVTCDLPTEPRPQQGWTLKYNIYQEGERSLKGTKLEVMCPRGITFTGEVVGGFTATCNDEG
jgi:hypothetical protein